MMKYTSMINKSITDKSHEDKVRATDKFVKLMGICGINLNASEVLECCPDIKSSRE